MRIIDYLFGTKKEPKPLILDENATNQWALQIILYQNLENDYQVFSDTVNRLKEQAKQGLRKLTSDETLMAVPDRARTMNAIHGKEYAKQVEKVVAIEFTNIFNFDKEQSSYFEANSTFKDLSAKNVAVLKEFMQLDLKTVQNALQQLEDTVINFTKTLDEKHFAQIMRIHEAITKIQQLAERGDKYQQLLVSVNNDLKRTLEKKAKLQTEIKEQETLVRKTEALQALEKMKKLEDELYAMTAQYVSVVQDLQNFYKKYTQFTPEPAVKKVMDLLPKDPFTFIEKNADGIKKVFEHIVTQVEDAQLNNTRTLIERLTRLANSVEQDGRVIATSLPDQRLLKREMMKDIAALNIYDKQQFLMRAQAEEDAIKHKIEYINAELDPAKKIALEQEMKDAARSFGAIIKTKEQATPITVGVDEKTGLEKF